MYKKILLSSITLGLIASLGFALSTQAQGDVDWVIFSQSAGEAYGKALADKGVAPEDAFGGSRESNQIQFLGGLKIGNDSTGYTFPTAAGTNGQVLTWNSAGNLVAGAAAGGGTSSTWATSTPDMVLYTTTDAQSNRYAVVIGATATTVQGAQLDVTGNTQLDFASTTYLTVDGPAIFNDTSSGTANVTIETDNATDTVFVNASNDRIGIGTSTPAYLLDIDGDLNVGVKGGATTTNMFYVRTGVSGVSRGLVGINGTSTPSAFLAINADGAYSPLFVGSSTGPVLYITKGSQVLGNSGSLPYIDFIWSGDTATDLLSVVALLDKVGIGTSTPAYLLDVDGDFRVGTKPNKSSSATTTSVFYVKTDTDKGEVGVNGTTTPFAYFAINADGVYQSFYVGSSTADIFAVENTGVVQGNKDSVSYIDFQWNGDNISNLFQIDVSADQVNINGILVVATTTVEKLTQGGRALATTTMSAAQTMDEADFINNAIIQAEPNIKGNTTITFPASSTISTWLANAGDRSSFIWHNATTTAGSYYTFAGGTGFNIRTATSTGTLILPTDDVATFDCYRGVKGTSSAGSIECTFSQYQ